MKKTVLLLLAVVVLGIGGYQVWLALRSDETRMRDALHAAATDFGAARLRAARVFHASYRDETTNADRALVQNALRYAFMTKTDSKTKGFVWRTHVVPDTLEFVSIEGDRAQTRFELWLTSAQDLETPIWHLRVEADWRRDPNEDWQITRSRHETLAGARPR